MSIIPPDPVNSTPSLSAEQMLEEFIAGIAAGGTSAPPTMTTTGSLLPNSRQGANGEPLVWVATKPPGEGASSAELGDPRPPFTEEGAAALLGRPFGATSNPFNMRTSVDYREVMPLTEAKQAMYKWYGSDTFARWGDLIKNLGLVEEGDARSIEALSKWWEVAVEQSVLFSQNGHEMTPWQVIQILAGDEAAIKERVGTGDGTGGPRVYRNTHINITNAQDAKHLIKNVLTQQLGRRPTEEEFEAFRSTLNAAERANPTVSITHVDEEGNQSSTTEGGFSQGAAVSLLEDRAQELPEYASYQAATYYANALFGALDSPV